MVQKTYCVCPSPAFSEIGFGERCQVIKDVRPSEELSCRGQGYNDDRDLGDWPFHLFLAVNSERWLVSVLSGCDGNWWLAVVEGAWPFLSNHLRATYRSSWSLYSSFGTIALEDTKTIGSPSAVLSHQCNTIGKWKSHFNGQNTAGSSHCCVFHWNLQGGKEQGFSE